MRQPFRARVRGAWHIALILLIAAALAGCNGRRSAAGNATEAGGDEPQGPGLYRDVTADSGLSFTYRNGEEGDHYAILESLGGGAALIDYDRDGLLDIFLPGGGHFTGPGNRTIKGHPCRLFKNLGGFKFKDVTREAGLEREWFYSHGAAVADIDKDGWPDLLVTGWGGVALFRNNKGKFEDITARAGLDKGLTWATSAGLADLDGDGFPDLYLCQYVNWSMDNNPPCPGYSGDIRRDVCPPKQFDPIAHRLYRNKGDGTFADVSKPAGLRTDGKGLGVLIVDLNADGKPDIYVANDTTDNFLYVNRSKPGELKFEEVGVRFGVALSENGVADGSMGVAASDFDGSGRPSLWVTNYENEMHGLYKNVADDFFQFSTKVTGISAIGRSYVGFGTAFLDFDGDGWEDIVITNGHVIRHSPRLRQRPVLLRNAGGARFEEASDRGGPYFRQGHIGRGLAVGDLDNDGRPDLVISHLNAPVALLRHDGPRENSWLGIELAGQGGRDITGARVVVEAGGRKLTRFAQGGGSYLSSGDRRLHFGLGGAKAIDKLTVVWPSGQSRQLDGGKLAANRYHRLVEGQQ